VVRFTERIRHVSHSITRGWFARSLNAKRRLRAGTDGNGIKSADTPFLHPDCENHGMATFGTYARSARGRPGFAHCTWKDDYSILGPLCRVANTSIGENSANNRRFCPDRRHGSSDGSKAACIIFPLRFQSSYFERTEMMPKWFAHRRTRTHVTVIGHDTMACHGAQSRGPEVNIGTMVQLSPQAGAIVNQGW